MSNQDVKTVNSEFIQNIWCQIKRLLISGCQCPRSAHKTPMRPLQCGPYRCASR